MLKISPSSAIGAKVTVEEERHRLTQDALADVDTGRVIDHPAIAAWAESLGKRKKARAPRRR